MSSYSPEREGKIHKAASHAIDSRGDSDAIKFSNEHEKGFTNTRPTT